MKKENLETKIKKSQIKNHIFFVWIIRDNKVVKAQANLISHSKTELKFKMEKKDLPYLMEMFSGSMELNFIIPESSLIFQSEFMSFEKDLLLVRTTGYHKNFERRSGNRSEPVVSLKIKFKNNGELNIKEVFDISGGGFSIVTSQNDKVKFPDEEFNAEFFYLSETHRCKVQKLEELKPSPYMLEKCPYAGQRYSFKFNSIGQPLKEAIKDMIAVYEILKEEK